MTTDYQSFTNKDTPKEERRRLNVGDIWNNSAQCLACNDIIRSKNVHDFVTCSCGNISVDGGSFYCKRSGTLVDYKDLSEMYNDI